MMIAARARRALTTLGHYAPHSFGLTSAAVVQPFLPRGPLWIAAVLWVLSVAWVPVCAAHVIFHERGLCERCAATAPEDPAASVRKWRPALRAFHGRALPAACTASALLLLAAIAYGGFRGIPRPLAAPGIVALAVIGAGLAVTYRHKALRPWCPWCNWGRGGWHEQSPVVPDPSEEKR